jgi:hypothetical protein
MSSGSAGSLTTLVLEKIAGILLSDYEGLFRRAYEDAVQVLEGARPLEPADEIRNAFDHFSIALLWAYRAEGPEVMTSIKLKQDADPKLEALVNLEQARRHLTIGRLHCIEHQIEALIKLIHSHGRSLAPPERPSFASVFEEADRLQDKYRETRIIVLDQMSDLRQIEQNIKDVDGKTEQLTRIAVEFLGLAKKFQKTTSVDSGKAKAE